MDEQHRMFQSSGDNSSMSQGHWPSVGAVGGSYPQQGGQYMNHEIPLGPGANPGSQQRFMMGGQMPNHMYGHTSSQPHMYTPSAQQPPGPAVSPAGRPPAHQQMQNIVQYSPSQLSPIPSVSSDQELTNPEDPSGENSRGSTGVPRPTPSPVGSTGSRSNTPASIPGAQAGSPMPVRPPSGQVDGQNRLTQSHMATQGFNQQTMPPPNNMGYMPAAGKVGGNQIPGHYPQYNPQFPQGNYGRQQQNMGTISGSPSSGPMQNYPGTQPNMYPNNPAQMPGPPMYGAMPGMVRSMVQPGYGSSQGPYSKGSAGMGGMMNSHYPGYSQHMGMLPGHHGMQQAVGTGPVPPGSAVVGSGVPNISGQQGGLLPQQHVSSSKAANSNLGPSTSHNRGSMSPSRGMFVQSGGGPLAQMNNMTNSPNLGSPSLNSMSNVVEQLARNSSSEAHSFSSMGNLATSAPSPVPHFPSSVTNSVNSGDYNTSQSSPMPNADSHDALSRPGSATAQHPDFPSDSAVSSGGMSNDSNSAFASFHSSDQSDKILDTVAVRVQSRSSPNSMSYPSNGDSSRTVENITPPDHTSHHPQHHLYHGHPHHPPLQQQQYVMGGESKMPYTGDDGDHSPLSSMSSMPSSSSSVVTTSNAGPSLTVVTQSITSPVTSISTSAPHNHPHPHHQGGAHVDPPHMTGHGMGPGFLGMMPNGIPPSSMMNPGHMVGPNHMPPSIGGPMHGMMPPNMGGPNSNMNHNGPVMGPATGHNGPMMSGHPGMNSGGTMLSMGHMPPQQQMNCMPSVVSNNSSSKNTPADQPPGGKKKKMKKQSAYDINKMFEMGPEPDRRHFLEHIFSFLEDSGQPVTTLPVISKTPLDLYKLYFSVREKGGFEEVTKSKKWRDICTVVNIGTSASAAFTLKKNYIRYLLNYECKFDRGGINPAPILAQMEAQLAHKREQKSKRAPSPASSNSNESFRPPSVPNNVDSTYQPPNMPPPYMQNPDGGMPNTPMGGNVMMGPNMTGPGSHGGIGRMVQGSPGMGPSMIGGPASNVMQPGLVPNTATGNMMGSHVAGGPPAYGGPMMQQHPGGPASQPPSNSASGTPVHNQSGMAGPMSDSITAQDPFADESGYLQQRGMPLQPTPPPQSVSGPMVPGFTGMQQGSMGSVAVTNTTSQPATSSVGYGGPEQAVSTFPPNSGRLSEPPPVSTSSGQQFPFGQNFERPDRFDQSSPNMVLRSPCPPPSMTHSQQPPAQQMGGDGNSVYSGARFPMPHQSVGLRPPPPGGDVLAQYPQQGSAFQGQGSYPGPQYPNYPQNSTGSFPGPRMPAGPGAMFGTPGKQFPDDHADRLRDGANWSPIQRSRLNQNGPGYMSPVPPSTPPMGQYGPQIAHKGSPQSREAGRIPVQQKMPPSYGGLAAAPLTKKEMSFPAGSVEAVGISTTRRKKLTSKDLAPFEPWRLMLALKSGLLAESTWALDTLNILLYDDSTYGYFGLNTLPGLLEVLTEHFRHCLMQMFAEFEDLEEGLSQKHLPPNGKLRPERVYTGNPDSQKENCELKDEVIEKKGKLVVFLLSGQNYTMVSRKGLPVKIDQNPSDSSVLDTKEWDLFSNFESKADHWLTGHGDITDHIQTHLESERSNQFLSGRFSRKRTRESDNCDERVCKCVHFSKGKRKNCFSTSADFYSPESHKCVVSQCVNKQILEQLGKNESVVRNGVSAEQEDSDSKLYLSAQKSCENSSSDANHSSEFNGDQRSQVVDSLHEGCSLTCSVTSDSVEHAAEMHKSSSRNDVKKKKMQKCADEKAECVKIEGGAADNHMEVDRDVANVAVVENGDVDNLESPEVNHVDDVSPCNASHLKLSRASSKLDVKESHCSSPPDLKAEAVNGEGKSSADCSSEPMNSSMIGDCPVSAAEVNLSAIQETSCMGKDSNINVKLNEIKEEQKENAEASGEDDNLNSSAGTIVMLNESFVSETEELSASIVAEMLKEDEHLEEEAFQRDDPPLCVTPESKDELGRRCVCISNIIRSLSCVPGNEDHISKHPGIMRVLGRLLLLHHNHPQKPPPRKLPCSIEEEEEREQLPRVYDDEHWWWDYLDQLRENTLVIVANICGHLKLGNFSEQICFPLLEGLLHWVVCPASVARDPLPTLPAGSVLSPLRLVLEALCKLCIHETNVDLLLATPPVKRLLELFSVLVRLLADRNHQITREFSIVLLSLLVSGESGAARALALQHPSVSLLVDFLETAEQNALAIANQQGLEVLQVNPEIMGTSLDMLRRAASILLQMARVPDNRKMFLHQQSRLLNLVMSQILDQSVSSTLSEVLFECSQVS